MKELLLSTWQRRVLCVFLSLFFALPSYALTILSWNTKHLGRDKYLADEATLLLRDADIVTFQEVATSDKGLAALKRVAELIGKKTGDFWCMGLSEIPTDSKERYAYLWRNQRISYVKTDGTVIQDCKAHSDGSAFTIRLGVKHASSIVREPAVGTFTEKTSGKKFTLASIHLVPTKKEPWKEVGPLFDTFSGVEGVVVVAGDFNLESSHPSFESAYKMGFKAALGGEEKTSLKLKARSLNRAYDNLFYKGAAMKRSGTINMLEIFSKIDIKKIYQELSDHCPVFLQLDL